MKVLFTPTGLAGVWIVEPEPHADARGFFARLWDEAEFAGRGLNPHLAQVSVSFNRLAGTLRGMHWQAEPHAEAKLVRATAGAIWDVALDLRPDSPTHRRWVAEELSAANRRMLYIPEGCAHGFQTLTDDAEVTYHISAAHEPASGRGARWDDPAFGIAWPAPPTVVGERDRGWASSLGAGARTAEGVGNRMEADDPAMRPEPRPDPISEALGRHYAETFDRHGPTSEGVDWGADASRAALRYDNMLGVLARDAGPTVPSLLDVGCGYGELLDHAARKGIALDYTGIDVAENMIRWATAHSPGGRFVHGDILSCEVGGPFDYVVCNGILTQKLRTSGLEMDRYAARLIRRMFSLCRRGAAFNVMTTKVNRFADNLYYRNPAELFSWCLSELTPHVRLDHAYPLYEYTMYLYRTPHAG